MQTSTNLTRIPAVEAKPLLRNQTKTEKRKSIYRGSPAFAEATARQARITRMGEKELDKWKPATAGSS
jgi:hypothetical protein